MAETSEAPYSRRTDSRDNQLTNPSREPSQARYLINDFILHPEPEEKAPSGTHPGSPHRHVILSIDLLYTQSQKIRCMAERLASQTFPR